MTFSTSQLFAALLLGTISFGEFLAAPAPPTRGADLFAPAIPGLVATDFCSGVDNSCNFGTGTSFWLTDNSRELKVDAQGNIYLPPVSSSRTTCVVGGFSEDIIPTEIYRVTPAGVAQLVGTFGGECLSDRVRSTRGIRGFGVDAVNGIMYLTVELASVDATGVAGGDTTIALSGLPTLLDIILSYQPPSTLSFNVPVRPEGLPGGDSFSVYAGDVRAAADLSQAVPLDCTVPAGRPPVPGEHLTVPDALPPPLPGESRYYLAAVNYQGQRRAGRSATNGTLQGRNAGALTGCQ